MRDCCGYCDVIRPAVGSRMTGFGRVHLCQQHLDELDEERRQAMRGTRCSVELLDVDGAVLARREGTL